MQKSENISDIAAAMAKAQGAFTAAERAHIAKVVSKKGEGSSYSYNYADLAAYLDVCRGPLAENNLSFVQAVSVADSKATVTTMLLHGSGQWIEFDPLSLCAENLTPQSIGSVITYARRYSLSAAIGMASEADDDGNAASGNDSETGKRYPACPKCESNTHVIKGKEEYGGGWLCWEKKGGCGNKWQDATPHADTRPPAKPVPEKANKLSKDDTGAFDYEGYFVEGMKKAKTDEARDLMREWLATNRDHFPETFHTNLERWYVASVRDAADRDRLTELAEMLDADGQWLQNAQKSKVKTSIDVKLREAAAA